ncbi:3-oxo-tetronate kinase [Aureimonas sp. AU4]|uniref:3-oxo-tetronate kinase n=2 Tax=Aureimonas sp. AU4 TaxID=1638163 RepID=UPI000784255D|nr:3-oxo-tetronate kinase [Aureimonas sp. AU4]
MHLGIIGDDVTGSSDVANTLARGGLRVVQYGGVPSGAAGGDVEAGVVALKSRTIPAGEAVALSLRALDWLLDQGCRQILFKVCSTFDSTKAGNIGPVAEALRAALAQRLGTSAPVPVCPAFPRAGRSLYQGHLFVADALLSESGMRDHPLTPMRDPDIRRWLGYQTQLGVGHVAAPTVFAGADAIRRGALAQAAANRPLVVVDAIRDEDLHAIGEAAADWPLLVGGSGLALGLPDVLRAKGLVAPRGGSGEVEGTGAWTGSRGRAAILSGSCSVMTRAQVQRHLADGAPGLEVSADEIVADGAAAVAQALAFAEAHADGPAAPLVYTSADPAVVAQAQARFGREHAAGAVEGFFAELARRLVAGGVTRLVTAGGETSGAVVEGLGVEALAIGPEIAPGVPAVRAIRDRPLWLALKSGNFGGERFFAEALDVLGRNAP